MKDSAARSYAIRQKLDHPIIDCDGHTIEFLPSLLEVITEVGGRELAEAYANQPINWHRLSSQERYEKRTVRPPWWSLPAENTLDRATAMLPALLRQRLDRFGIDFSVIYPTVGLFFMSQNREEWRRVLCRAINRYHSEIFGPHADRLTPVAVIPMHTPQEAIAELEYAVGTLGFKAIMIPGHVRRPHPEVERIAPEVRRHCYWLDHLALGSPFDYDPFWAKCVELQVAVTEHSGSMGVGTRNAVENYVFNHIGHFAAAGEAFCKALVMGGVSRRFPELRFAFLEGGAGWAASLYSDLLSHWEKRNGNAVRSYDPGRIDYDLLAKLFREFGAGIVRGDVTAEDFRSDFLNKYEENPGLIDEWSEAGFGSAEELRDAFQPNFFFGCEADDPATAHAYNRRTNPYGVELKAVFSSDIGHWDVPDMECVLEEAYELVENGVLDEAQFRRFTFEYPAELHASLNPEFFRGTVVEGEAPRRSIP